MRSTCLRPARRAHRLHRQTWQRRHRRADPQAPRAVCKAQRARPRSPPRESFQRSRACSSARPAFAELHDDLPWDSFDVARADPEDLLEARMVWTNGVFTEYASAAAFSAMNLAFLQCGAPVDLCAAAADFALDELVHVTLVS